jgi:hypothetical protein
MGFFDRMRSAFSEVEKILADSDKPSTPPVGTPVNTPRETPSETPAGATSGLFGAREIDLTGEPPVAAPGGMPRGVGATTGMPATQAEANAQIRMQAESMDGVPSNMIGGIGFGAIGGMPMGARPIGGMSGGPNMMSGMGLGGMPMGVGVFNMSGGIGGMSPDGMPMGMGTPIGATNPWQGTARPNIYAPVITIEEQVLLDEEGLTITALAYDVRPEMDDFIKVKIENALDTVISVKGSNICVNGYCLSDIGFHWAVVPKNMKSETYESVVLGVWKLEAAGLKAFGQIDFHLSIMWRTASENKTIERDVTIRTSAYNHMDTEIKDRGTELIVREGVHIFSKYVRDESPYPTPYVTLYAENNTGSKRAIFYTYYSLDSDSTLGNMPSSVVLEDGQKSIFILPVTNDQAKKILVNLVVSDTSKTVLTFEQVLIPLS